MSYILIDPIDKLSPDGMQQRLFPVWVNSGMIANKVLGQALF